ITVTVLSGGYNIIKEFNPLSKLNTENQAGFSPQGENYSLPQSDTLNTGSKKTATSVKFSEKETIILKKAEHIFLYLLPIFIVFGFFNYYKTNTRVYFIEGNLDSVRHEDSTKGMNMTKVLFIASLVSYVLIKTIEEIFSNPVNWIKLVAAGTLLAMLMKYYLLLDKRNHPQSAKSA
ncbi:MAG: hypothetical protein ABW019_16515, partial [Chitinophagaceae bacterium]